MFQLEKLRKKTKGFMMTNESTVSPTNFQILEPMYASLSRRLGAFLIDCFLLGVLSVIGSAIIPVLGSILVWFFYAPVLDSSELRGTVGKNLMGIQVTDLMGRRISLRAALIRNLMKIVSSAIIFIGFFFALFNRQKQTLHDLLAETIVVYGRSEVPITEGWLAASKDLFQAGKAKLESVSPKAEPDSLVTQLERLNALRTQNVISEEEYQAAKKKILQ